jgi:hypothetical protein
MSYSQYKSQITFAIIALLVAMVSLASWQFYKYATFTHDNGSLNVNGGGSHLVIAVLLTLSACVLGFFVATRVLQNNSEQELHITAPPSRRN